MATFQKVETVEARQYSGPRLTVINDAKGEQVAHDGDYLLGTERGKVSVVSKAVFEAEYQAYTPTPDAEKLATDEAKIAEMRSQFDALEQVHLAAITESQGKTAEVNELTAKISDQTQLKAQFTTVSEQLASEKANSATLQGKLDALVAAEAAKADAQAKLDAAAKSIDNLSH